MYSIDISSYLVCGFSAYYFEQYIFFKLFETYE